MSLLEVHVREEKTNLGMLEERLESIKTNLDRSITQFKASWNDSGETANSELCGKIVDICSEMTEIISNFTLVVLKEDIIRDNPKSKRLSALTPFINRNRDSGISSASDSSRCSSPNRLSDNIISKIGNVEDKLESSTWPHERQNITADHQNNIKTVADNSENEPLPLDNWELKQEVRFFLESKDEDVNDFEIEEELNVPCILDKDSDYLPPVSDNIADHHLRRQRSVDVSSTSSLPDSVQRSVGLIRRIYECVRESPVIENDYNNLSRLAVQHSESSEDDNNKQALCAQISGSSSGGSLPRFTIQRAINRREVSTQTEAHCTCCASGCGIQPRCTGPLTSREVSTDSGHS